MTSVSAPKGGHLHASNRCSVQYKSFADQPNWVGSLDSETLCHGPNVPVSPTPNHVYVEVSTPNVILRGRAFETSLGLDKVMRVGHDV